MMTLEIQELNRIVYKKKYVLFLLLTNNFDDSLFKIYIYFAGLSIYKNIKINMYLFVDVMIWNLNFRRNKK